MITTLHSRGTKKLSYDVPISLQIEISNPVGMIRTDVYTQFAIWNEGTSKGTQIP